MWHLDLAFADVVSTSSDPRLGAVRLAWWREQLESLDRGSLAPAEPRLQAVVNDLMRFTTGEALSRLEDAWLPALEPFPWDLAQANGFRLRGRILFGIGAQLLGGEPAVAEGPGELWSLIDGVQHCSDAPSRDIFLSEAKKLTPQPKMPLNLRPLTILTAVAVSSIRHHSSGLARGIAAARHRFGGRISSL